MSGAGGESYEQASELGALMVRLNHALAELYKDPF
jgi:hypothetical protein